MFSITLKGVGCTIMDMFQLKYFVTAANLANFTLASYENSISQSSLSKQIMSLEDELGVKLFERKKRTVILTAAGEHFLEYAYKMLNIYDEMRNGMESFTTFQTLPVRVASIPVMLPYSLEDVIFQIKREFPELIFSIMELPESSYVLKALRREECDFAILRTDFLNSDIYRIYPVVEDHLCAVLPTCHPLAGQQMISLKDLKDDIFILPPKASDLRLIAEKACITAGFRPNIGCITSGNIDLTLKIAQEQNMVYLAFENVINYYQMPGCTIIPLHESIKSWTAFVTPKRKVFSKTTRKIMEFLEKEYAAHANS